ncbi:hypothetical protein [Chryseobacterium sp. KCF3-3]|uniref:hypothetical protein n=1 Tax=Chryseobacterium sp. KCF3-3 TaxID=3231511 RepID=UPI0038B394B3
MNAKKIIKLEQEKEKNELLEEFQVEELEQRFEMRLNWFDGQPTSTPIKIG